MRGPAGGIIGHGPGIELAETGHSADAGFFFYSADQSAVAEHGSSSFGETLEASPPPARADAPLGSSVPIPERLGDYEILAEVGRGGMGVVYKARQRRLNRLVAVKTILAHEHASAEQLLRFQREAEMAARVRHPNVVQVYEVGTHRGRPFIAMEWIEGPTLAHQLGDRPLSTPEAAQLTELLALAVQAAHSQGVIHRDLKPANVLMQIADSRLQIEGKDEASSLQSSICNLKSAIPKITDFGLRGQSTARAS